MRAFHPLLVAAALLSALPAGAITLPTGFASETIVGGFDKPVVIAVAADGRMFVAEKKGVLWLVQNGVRGSAPLLDLRAEVNKEADRGLLGLALHPDFATNGYLYVLYVYDDIAGTAHRANDEAVLQRLERFTFSNGAISLNSRKLLLGATAADSPAECYTSHAVGTVRFALDGTMFVSTGDGAHWDFIDGGQDVTANDPSCRALYGAAEDVGALRSQRLDSLAGKILRIDPATGLGVPSNPFWDGNPASKRSRIWSIGYKSPFRFGLRAGTSGPGTLFIGDVGTDLYEEIDVSRGGENFGWPCFEGPGTHPGYQSGTYTSAACSQLSASAVRAPFWSSPHNHTNRATGGVIEYRGGTYPSKYRGAFFIGDYAQSFLKVLLVDASERLVGVEDFATGADNPVDLEIDPRTGDVLYVSISTGEIRRLRYSSSNLPPVAAASAQPTAGAPPLAVTFSSNGSRDPESGPLVFDWDFGDGTAHSSAANPTHTYTTLGRFTATLTVRDDRGQSASATVAIATASSPPVARITNPADGTRFTDGQVFQFQASASDPDGDRLTYAWGVTLVHSAHEHFDLYESNLLTPPPFTALSHGTGERYSYLVTFTATDPSGLSAQHSVHLIPEGLANGAPVAAFTATPQTGAVPLTVSFDSSSSTDPDDDLLERTWEFGDGTRASGLQVSHTYDRAGTYVARLTVTDIFGASSSATRSIAVTAGTVSADLIAAWPLDEGSGLVAHDTSGNALDGAIGTGSSWIAGRFGQALAFDGVGTKVRIGTSPLLARTGRVTLAAWVKLANPTQNTYMRLLSKKPRWDAPEGYALSYNPYKQLFEILGSGSDSARAAGVRLDTGWHHLAAVVDGGSARLYVDGVDRTTDSVLTPLVAGSTALVMGGEAGGGGLVNGALDDVRIYGRALAASEIAALQSATTPPPPPPGTTSAAHWTFDEGGGAIATDDVAAIPCTLKGAGWTAGLDAFALSLPGSNAHADCGAPASLAYAGPITIATWVKVGNPSLSAYMRLVSSKATWDAPAGFDLTYNPAKQLLQVHGSGPDTASATGVSLGTGWRHVAAVIDGTRARLYVDGVERTSEPTVSAVVANVAPVRIGRDGAGNSFVGALDDLRLYPRALTAQEIAALAVVP